ncbi:uncharacterized protein BDR25DRAFT_351445 [Lindgomyces ingoldianus]|uniref:Uncharacterized protein n=1 Tax=Lindgomyces ingoldianus TaxID=673940 RepID=A0ACB6R7A2_9PLEO|nr:uncharacterized protein BDR25DRAFT_351445 [Lindgomyces ingoldianus]KAF2474962.1 hypothetical protein BDR25DRAFT_351445 [Lindgomyces ingoldianus]
MNKVSKTYKGAGKTETAEEAIYRATTCQLKERSNIRKTNNVAHATANTVVWPFFKAECGSIHCFRCDVPVLVRMARRDDSVFIAFLRDLAISRTVFRGIYHKKSKNSNIKEKGIPLAIAPSPAQLNRSH